MPFYTIKAGCRSNEAQDWAQMLLTMYMRWAGRSGYTLFSRIINGERAGIVEAMFTIDCEPELLESEIGVHRLVRTSPFDAERRRHTSFAELAPTDSVLAKQPSLGAQIRSYVLSPYHLVKDTRTKMEIKDVSAVLEGHIEPFIEGYAKLKEKRD